MQKTTVYLPDDLKQALTRTALEEGTSEADLIRRAIAAAVQAQGRRPRGALFASGDPTLSESVEAALAGFGDR